MADAVIVSTARTPIGKAYRGAFNMTHGATLGGHVIKHAVERAGIEPAEVEDVILGCAMPEGATGGNIARQSALRAGLPVTVAGADRQPLLLLGPADDRDGGAARSSLDEVPVAVAGGVEVDLLRAERGLNKHMLRDDLARRAQAGASTCR